jgi:hypothetical protein
MVALLGMDILTMREWAKEWNYCRKCLTTDVRHASEGYCEQCLDTIIQSRLPRHKARLCLSCNTRFFSEWEGNRRCDDCLRREKENNYLDKEPHRVNVQ